jgi:polyhydroxyalkanoate synthesis regulator protein
MVRMNSMSRQILVKRYAGGRLYDTSGARYVTVAMLRQWLKRKIDFCVMDATTGGDVTRVVLA